MKLPIPPLRLAGLPLARRALSICKSLNHSLVTLSTLTAELTPMTSFYNNYALYGVANRCLQCHSIQKMMKLLLFAILRTACVQNQVHHFFKFVVALVGDENKSIPRRLSVHMQGRIGTRPLRKLQSTVS